MGFRLFLNIVISYCHRFFDQVGHQTTYSSIGNQPFFTKWCHWQTYHNYEQRQQILGTFLKIRCFNFTKFSRVFLSWSPSLIFIIGIKKENDWFSMLKKDLESFLSLWRLFIILVGLTMTSFIEKCSFPINAYVV